MALIVHAGEAMARQWAEALCRLDPALDIRLYPEIGDPADAECLLSWKPPPGLVPSLTRLRLLHCSGAGVDQILGHPDIPADLPIARIVDSRQAEDLAVYVLAAVFAWFRRLDDYRALQAEARWERLFPHPSIGELRVGVMGLGEMGGMIARRFAACGARVVGWSSTGRPCPGVETFAGEAGLDVFLRNTGVLVCALPLTPETAGILSGRVLEGMLPGGYLVNIGRGAHLVEDDLIRLLDSDRLAGAALDVHRDEPLPADHAFWGHPRIRLTPHIAAFATPERVAPQILENLQRVRRGEVPLNQVHLARGY